MVAAAAQANKDSSEAGASVPALSAGKPAADACPQAEASSAQRLLDIRLRTLIDNYPDVPARATLALLQLANFYEILRWVGKSQASQLLADITRLLQKSLPAGALLCRCANYEFAVLLEGEHSDRAASIGKRVETTLQSAASSALPAQLQLRCAVGLASLGKHTRLPEVLFARARHGLGRNSLQPVLDEQQSLAAARQILRGLRANQLSLTFQPLVPLRAGESCCYEVRSQLDSPTGRLPGRSLYPAAVDNALGESLDRWVVRACLARLQRAELNATTLVVNISLTTLVSGRFPNWLKQLLQSHPHPGEGLMLQISELDLLVAQHHLRSFSLALKTLGIPLAITHVGCSQDPLRYLTLLRIRRVKLDSSLLNNLAPASPQLEILTALVTALHERQIQVAIGEVEDLHLLPLLWQAGLDLVQGNALQPPAGNPARHCVTDLVLTA